MRVFEGGDGLPGVRATVPTISKAVVHIQLVLVTEVWSVGSNQFFHVPTSTGSWLFACVRACVRVCAHKTFYACTLKRCVIVHMSHRAHTVHASIVHARSKSGRHCVRSGSYVHAHHSILRQYDHTATYRVARTPRSRQCGGDAAQEGRGYGAW